MRALFLYLPSYVSTGEVKIHAARDGIAQNFGACRCVEGTFVVAKEDLAISRVRAKPEQRPERMAMYHTVALVEIQSEHQGINVVAPSGRIFAAGQAINSVHGPIAPPECLLNPTTSRLLAMRQMHVHRKRQATA